MPALKTHYKNNYPNWSTIDHETHATSMTPTNSIAIQITQMT
jgi:hypothetical protein